MWRNIYQPLKTGLITGMLFIATVVGLQVSAYLAQLSEITTRVEAALTGELQASAAELRATSQHAQGVLLSARGTTEITRKSAVEQMGYYGAAGHRMAQALAHLELLITHTGTRLERITRAIESNSA